MRLLGSSYCSFKHNVITDKITKPILNASIRGDIMDMKNADPKMLNAVKAFLNRQGLEYSESEEEYCSKISIKSGSKKAFVSVYNTGKIVVSGGKSALKSILEQMKRAIDTDAVIPGQMLPFEIEKFPDTIQERVPECDPVIIRFINEAIICLRADALLGTAFMLGAASEKAIAILIDSFAHAIRDESNRNKFLSRINRKMISIKYNEFEKSYRGCKSRPTDSVLAQDLEVIIGSMFQYCRITRNEVGHPQIVPDLDRGVLIANMGQFANYIQRIYGLVKYFNENGVEV